MKRICVFANCQGPAIGHFLSKVPNFLNEYSLFYARNWQYLMTPMEADPEELMREAARCDVFLYQPTSALKHGMLSSEEMIAQVVPKSAIKLSWGYVYNHGLFPVLKHPAGWITGKMVMDRAREDRTDRLLNSYKAGLLRFDCVKRFAACLAEQSRREVHTDLKFADFIVENFQKHRLFLTENHPSSFFFAHMAREVAKRLGDDPGPIPILKENEAGLPCCLDHHPFVSQELGMDYVEENPDLSQYDRWIQELMEKKGNV